MNARGLCGRSPVMIGRSDALGRLLAVVETLDAPTDDEPVIALISGEAGIGKTRLLHELLGRLPKEIAVLYGGAQPRDEHQPFGLVRSLVGTTAIDSNTHDGWIDAIQSKLGTGPSVVVLEDLHWADSDSVGVIDLILRQSRPQVMVVGTYRPEDVSRRTPGGELIVRWERRGLSEQISLERMSRSEVADFVMAITDVEPSSALIETLLRRSGGNPFVIEELVSCSGSSPESIDAASLPWSLAEAMAERLAALSDSQRLLVQAVAVCGGSAHFDVLIGLTEADERALVGDLAAMVTSELLVEHSYDRFGFRHALMSDAVSAQVLGRERRRLHQRALEILGHVAPDDLAARARHAAGAGAIHEMVALSTEAAQVALKAGRSFEALRLADAALHEEPDDPTLLAIVAEAAWLVGLCEEAFAAATHLYNLAAVSRDVGDRARGLRWRSRLAFELGDLVTMSTTLDEMIAFVETMPIDAQQAEVIVHIAQMKMLDKSVSDAIAWADRAIEAADRIGLPRVRRQAMIERASARVDQMGLTAKDELLHAVSEATSAADWVLVTRGLNNVLNLVPSRTEEHAEVLSQLSMAVERSGFDAIGRHAAACRAADHAWNIGEMTAFRQAADVLRRCGGGRPLDEFHRRAIDAILAREAGPTTNSRGSLAGDDDSRPGEANRSDFHLATVELTMLAGRPPDLRSAAFARELLARCVAGLPSGDEASVSSYLSAAEDALSAGLATHEVDQRLSPVAAGTSAAGALRGVIAAVRGDHAEVVTALAPCLESPSVYLAIPQVGHLRSLLAEAYLRLGARPAGLTQARLAATELARWPGWRRDRAVELVAQLEAAVDPVGSSPLTVRELEVAALLAEGLTNAELAGKLYISPKTAAVHVSNILMKLAMTNRAEVAAWAVRTGVA